MSVGALLGDLEGLLRLQRAVPLGLRALPRTQQARHQTQADRRGEQLPAAKLLEHALVGALLPVDPRREVGDHRRGVGVSVLGLRGGGAGHDRAQLCRGGRLQRCRRRHVAGDHPSEDRPRAVALEGPLAGEQLEQAHAQRPDVRALVHDVAGGLLGAHVGGGAEHRAHCGGADAGQHRVPVRLLGDHRPREAPVHHLRLAERAEQDVVGLQVAVDDAAVVGVGHRLAGAEERPKQPHPAGQAALFCQQHRQGPPPDDPHGVPGPSVVVAAGVEDRHDAWVVERRRDPRLSLEPHRGRAVRVAARGLEGDLPAELVIFGEVDGAHPALAEHDPAGVAGTIHQLVGPLAAVGGGLRDVVPGVLRFFGRPRHPSRVTHTPRRADLRDDLCQRPVQL